MRQILSGGGNIYNKYTTQNPVAKLLMARFLKDFDALVAVAGATNILEVGCGEGRLACRLARNGLSVTATEPSREALEKARHLATEMGLVIHFERAAIEELDPSCHAAPLVICCEVLEHVASPDDALEHLSRLAAPWLLASVPREPLWRVLNLARGAYWRSRGNTPGHVNHWSRRAFLAFLSKSFEVIKVRSPLPWTLVLARRGIER
jgi:SAM-dependent methyltransferase